MAFFDRLRQAFQSESVPTLRLSVPHCAVRKQPLQCDPELLAQQLRREGKTPCEKLRIIHDYLQLFNCYLLKAEQRLALLKVLLRFACPELSKIYGRYLLDEHCMGEQPERCASLNIALQVVQGLMTGHKHVLLHDYQLTGRAYDQVAERVMICALRVLELLRMEQRIRAIRYQKLVAQNWTDCSRIFFAMRDRSNIDESLPLLGNLCEVQGIGVFDAKQATESSLHQIYLSIQLFGLFDMVTWSPRQTPFLDVYLQALALQLVTIPDDKDELPLGWVILFQDSIDPPSFSRVGRAGREAVLLNLWPIEKRLRIDQAILLGEDCEEELSPALRALPENQQLIVVERLLQRMQPVERIEARHAIHKEKYVQIYSGFVACYELFLDQLKDSEKIRKKRELRDALSKQAGLVDSESENADRWRVADVSYSGMKILAQESAYMHEMQIGQMIIFRLYGEGESEFQLGYIVRIQRTQDKMIELAILKLSQSLDIMRLLDIHSQTVLAAGFLIHTLSDDWQLVVQVEQGIDLNTTYLLDHPSYDHFLTIQLGKQGVTTQEFKLFDLQVISS